MRAKKKLLSLLLGGLIAGLLPTTALAAGTKDTGKGIQTGAACISDYNLGIGKYDYIYYGMWNDSPIKWRVLSVEGNGGTYVKADDSSYSGKPLFLLSEVLLSTDTTSTYGNVRFNDSGSTAWQGSIAQSWCKEFSGESGTEKYAAKAFTASECNAVLKTTKSDTAYPTSNPAYIASENILNGDRVFFLSAEEASESSYGFREDDGRIAMYGTEYGVWWLRSARTPDGSPGNNDIYVGVIEPDGSQKGYSVDDHYYAARPAFNLNPDSVLLTSAAKDGKPEGFSEVAEYGGRGREWKLTLLDENRNNFSARIRKVDTEYSVAWTGATTGANEYVSALIKNSSGTVTYYGRLKNLTDTADASGEVAINFSDKMKDGDKLYIFNEQYNGDCQTDYASELKEMTIPTKDTVYTVSFDANGGTGTMNSEEVSDNGKISILLPANKFTAPAGKQFKAWAEGSVEGDSWAQNVSYTVKSDTTFYAIWEDIPKYSISADVTTLDFGTAYVGGELPDKKTVTITNTGNQQITLEQPTVLSLTIGELSQTNLAPGETATFTVQPKDLGTGKYNVTITVKDKNSKANIVSIQARFNLEASAPPTIEWSIGVSASPAEGGSVIGGGDYSNNASVTVTATANSGYRFVAWMEDGKLVSTDASYTFQADGNRDLVAVFEQEGATHTHTWGEWVSNGDGTHSRTCTGDSTHIETENCSGGTATCVSEAVCAVCKAVYGNKDMSNHAGGTEVRDRVEATADSEGYTGDTWCLGCNTKIAAGEVIPKKDSVSGGDSGNGGNDTPPSDDSNSGNDTPSASDEEEDDEDSTPATNTQAGAANAAEAVDNAPAFIICTIQKGDTLGAIARRYGCTVSEIMAANSDLIKNPNRIYLGWQLKIPQKKAAGTGTTTDITLSDGRKAASYIVKRGDSLWAIARKNGCTVSEILALNKDLITNPGMILAGWELKVPQK